MKNLTLILSLLLFALLSQAKADPFQFPGKPNIVHKPNLNYGYVVCVVWKPLPVDLRVISVSTGQAIPGLVIKSIPSSELIYYTIDGLPLNGAKVRIVPVPPASFYGKGSYVPVQSYESATFVPTSQEVDIGFQWKSHFAAPIHPQ